MVKFSASRNLLRLETKYNPKKLYWTNKVRNCSEGNHPNYFWIMWNPAWSNSKCNLVILDIFGLTYWLVVDFGGCLYSFKWTCKLQIRLQIPFEIKDILFDSPNQFFLTTTAIYISVRLACFNLFWILER